MTRQRSQQKEIERSAALVNCGFFGQHNVESDHARATARKHIEGLSQLRLPLCERPLRGRQRGLVNHSQHNFGGRAGSCPPVPASHQRVVEETIQALPGEQNKANTNRCERSCEAGQEIRLDANVISAGLHPPASDNA